MGPEDKEKLDESINSMTPPEYMPSVEPQKQSEQANQNQQSESSLSLETEAKPEIHTGKTAGVSDDSLAKTGMSIHTVILIAFFVAVFAFLAGWFGHQELVAKPTDAESNSPVINKSTGSTSTTTTTSKMTMLKINKVADYTWESDPTLYGTSSNIPNIAYSLGGAFRIAADVPDVGGYVGQYTGKEWVAIEVKATDNRTSGQSRQIYYADNMRLADKGAKIPPIEDPFLQIKPLETKTFYVAFPIDKSSNSFELMMGDLAKPSLFKIDFAKGVKQTGYFTMRGGFSETQ